MKGIERVTVIASMLVAAVATIQSVRGQAPDKFDGTFGHVGIIVPNMEAAAKNFSGVFGVEVPAGRVFPGQVPFPPGFTGNRSAGVKSTSFQVNNIRIELLEPIGGPSPWKDQLDRHGMSLHHLRFDVKDLAGTIRTLEGKGGKWVMGGVSGANFAYVDMADRLGFTVELGGPAPAPAAAAPK